VHRAKVTANKAGIPELNCVSQRERNSTLERHKVAQMRLLPDNNIFSSCSYHQKCHTTYTTDFLPEQEEKCEENFKKNCFIEYHDVAHNETVEFCHTPLVKDCNLPGPVECRTEYESVCETRDESMR
jgi:hypothetical protein